MTRTVFLVAVLTILHVVVPCPSAAQSKDPVVGTWELNVSKSTSAGPPAKSQTRAFEVIGDQIRAVFKGINADGTATAVQYTARYDGKDVPYTGSPTYDTIALTRVDSHTVAFVQKKDGRVLSKGTRSISQDGKVMTVSGKGTNPQGQPIDFLLVFEKR